MASCKDCMHEKVCDYYGGDLNEVGAENCVCFKDRTRFVELPCKVGEELYRIKTVSGKKIITETQLNQNTFWRIVFGGEYGKTVFLTRKEAERVLKRSVKQSERRNL